MREHITRYQKNIGNTITKAIFFVALAFLPSACQFYHNTTARYNAYFLADEKMREVETAIFGNMKDDFNDFLRVMPEIDTVSGKAQKTGLDYCIQKASLPIQWHSESKWADYCYLIVAKSRLYQGDFPNGLSTLKYVNANGKDPKARHQALILLMRYYIYQEEHDNVKYIGEYVVKEYDLLDKSNKRDFHLALAHYYRSVEDFDNLAENLNIALELVKENKTKGRLHYLLGQIYDSKGQDTLAYQNYKAVLKTNPGFDLFFHASLKARGLEGQKGESDVQGTYAYFKKLLNDTKYVEYKDKVYYETALFDLKQNKVDPALENLNHSLRNNISNDVQKAYSYLKMGELYYERKKDYGMAALYYDSVLQTMPKEMRGAEAIAKRAGILERFALQYSIMAREDKLQGLRAVSESEQTAFFEKEIAKEKETIRKNRAAAEAQKKLQEKLLQQQEAMNTNTNTSDDQNAWYFYNRATVTRGGQEFKRVWGNRPQEDDWRRSRKEKDFDSANPINNPDKKDGAGEGDIFAGLPSVKDRIAEIPKTEEQLAASNLKLQNSLFMLGKIYAYELEERTNSNETLARFIKSFPDSVDVPEAHYVMYRVNMAEAEKISKENKQILLQKYAGSLFAKLAEDPEYFQTQNQQNQAVGDAYKKCYELYKNAEYGKAMAAVELLIKDFPESSHVDKFRFLRALLVGRTNTDVQSYADALNDFIKNNRQSDLVPHAEKLLNGIN